MTELQRSQSVARESAVLVGVLLDGRPGEEDPLEELEGLVSSAGARVADKLTQRRDVPDVMLGVYDYPARDRMPAFNLALRVNFVNGSDGTSGFRFVGSEGTLTIGGSNVTVSRVPRESEPGFTISTFPETVQEEFLKQYKEKYPPVAPTADAIRPQSEERYQAPRGYSDHIDHHRVFFEAVRSRKAVTEDATFGLRAAGPALLSNLSQHEQRTIEWDPQTMRVKGA